MSPPVLRVKFVDMWSNFDPVTDWFPTLLRTRYDVQLVDDPDLLVFSLFGTEHRQYTCRRLLLSGENRPWGFSTCDYALTSDYHPSPRHRRLPVWVHTLHQRGLDLPAGPPPGERGFAAVVVSNARCPQREHIHDLLETLGPVASGGRHRNNTGGPVADKLSFMSQYRFGLACENSVYHGYTTEKLLEALMASTVPVYWGDPSVARDFNPRRFVDARELGSDEALLARIGELEDRPDLYDAMVSEPWFAGGETPACADPDALLDWFEGVRTSTRPPVGTRSRWSPVWRAHRLIDEVRASRRRIGTTSWTREVKLRLRRPKHALEGVRNRLLRRRDVGV